MNMNVLAFAFLPVFLLVSVSVAAQDARSVSGGAVEQDAAVEAPLPAPVSAAGWCAIKSTDEEPSASTSADGEEGTEEVSAVEKSTVEDPGCDVGVVLRLYAFTPRLSAIGAIGTSTVGLGFGLTAYRTDRMVYGVGVAAVAPYDGDGIYVDRWTVAVGATLSFLHAGSTGGGG